MKEIPLTQGRVALVDDDMYEYLNQWNWYAAQKESGKWYAQRNTKRENGRQKTIFMHLLVMPPPEGMEVAHKDNQRTLDNRRENLRFCTRAQNTWNRSKSPRNTSGYIGVSWNKNEEKYTSAIRVGGKICFPGYFDDPEKAARAYDEKARESRGEFAVTNF